MRLDRRLRARVDPSDVLQEAFLDVVRQAPGFAEGGGIPPFLWLRLVTGQRLARVHPAHIGAAARDVGREVSIDRDESPMASSDAMAAQSLGRMTSISQALARSERKLLLEQAPDAMEPIDREIIALRHFEELSNAEAEGLRAFQSAAGNRFVRALARLQVALRQVPGLLD